MSKQGAFTTAVYHAVEHRLTIDIIFTPREAALFGQLARNIGRIVTTDMKISELWPMEADEPEGAENSVAVHLHNIREKLSPLKIETVQGAGTMMMMKGKIKIDWETPE